MKRAFPLLALALLSCSQTTRPPDVEVTGAWARATMPGRTTTAAYFTISNRGGGDDALLSVTATSGFAQLHSTSMDRGIMRMRSVERLPIAAGEMVKLEPGGTHLMLTELRMPLVPGRRIELSLRFEKSGERKVAAEVRDSLGEHA
ncbi:MAG: copper chaperone PCu(A)C [Sphingomonas sp.]|jgi:copper(I)-binding protein|nr:copper chaperone PCu(A)C [Sphingomonas sp.]